MRLSNINRYLDQIILINYQLILTNYRLKMAKTKIVLVSIGWTLVKDRLGCVYFPSYSLKWVSCFMLKQLMTSWYLNIWKFKIWLSQEWKELSKWKKKFFLLVSQFLSFKHTRQTKNVADATFKSISTFTYTSIDIHLILKWIWEWVFHEFALGEN